MKPSTFFSMMVIFFCAMSGCVQIPRHVAPIAKPTLQPPPSLREITVEVVLLSEAGMPVPGVNVTAESKFSTSEGKTNPQGKVQLPVMIADEEPISFLFQSAGIDWLEPLNNPPRGQTFLRAAFGLDSRNRVHLKAFEY